MRHPLQSGPPLPPVHATNVYVCGRSAEAKESKRALIVRHARKCFTTQLGRVFTRISMVCVAQERVYARLEANVHQPLTPRWRTIVPPIQRIDIAEALIQVHPLHFFRRR